MKKAKSGEILEGLAIGFSIVLFDIGRDFFSYKRHCFIPSPRIKIVSIDTEMMRSRHGADARRV